MIEAYHLQGLLGALVEAQRACVGDSNDAEHDALLGLMDEAEAILTAAGIDVPEPPDEDDDELEEEQCTSPT